MPSHAFSRAAGHLLVVLGLALPDAASGALVTFVDRSAWEAALGRPSDFTETFDGFTADTSFQLTPVDLAAFSVAQVPARDDMSMFHNNNSVQVAPFPDGSMSDHGLTTPHLNFFVEGDSLLRVQMTFPDSIDAWGAETYVSTSFGIPRFQIGFDDGSQVTIDLPGTGGGLAFFGIIADNGERIRDFTIAGIPDGNFASGNRILMDDVSGRWAPIPEPASSLLLGGGVAVLTLQRRRAARTSGRG